MAVEIKAVHESPELNSAVLINPYLISESTVATQIEINSDDSPVLQLESNHSSKSESIIQQSEVTIIDFTHPFQRSISEWHKVRGEIQPSDVASILQDKSKLLKAEISALTHHEKLGFFDDENKKIRMVREMNYALTATVDLLTAYGFDVDEMLFNKEVVMEEKYPPDSVTELRLFGPEENPGSMSAKDAMKYLKSHYNTEKEKQEYVFRNLSIPIEEEGYRTYAQRFTDRDQRFIDKWQIKAFGSDFDAASVIIPNMIGENDELIAEITKLTMDEINDPRVDKSELAKEGIDFIIGVLGVLSAWEQDAGQEFEQTIKYLKNKYKHVRHLVANQGLEPIRAMHVIKDDHERRRNGLRRSFLALSSLPIT